MVDTLSILIAHAVLVFIAVRALILDSQMPWFESAEDEAEREEKEAQRIAKSGKMRRRVRP